MKIVCFGDSLTSCGGEAPAPLGGRFSDILQDRFPGHEVVNRGVGGEGFIEARERLQTDVLDERPDIVLIEYGANDWWRNERRHESWAADLDYCITRIRKAGGRPVVLGVFGPYLDEQGRYVEKQYGFDDRAEAYRRLERETAERHGCPYVPNIQQSIVGRRRCWLDSNHPNEYGNRHVADAIEPVLEKLLQTPAKPVRKPNLETLRDYWREAVALAPDRTAVVDGDRRLTYADADALVEQLAAGLAEAVPARRPKVAVCLPNCLDYYLIYWAVQRLGGAIIPLNTWLKQESVSGIFRSVKPDALIVRGSQDASAIQVAESVGAAVFAAAASDGLRLYGDLLRSDAAAPETAIAPDDLAIIMHTSGTTATPKGAMMRHCDLMFNVCATINAQYLSPNDVHLLVNPMFHCTALYSSLPAAAYQKAPVVITDSSACAAALMELVERERITTFLSIPSIFQKILALRDLPSRDSSSLRVMAYAGSPMPVHTIRELRAAFPDVALHNFFGLTETISATHVLRNDDVEGHPESIGRLLPFVEARVVDDELRPLPPGEVGELLFAREGVISGYYNQPGRLDESIIELDGRLWFRTGDLAAVDTDGFFYIKGRKKDMIIVGGENVFAVEVEGVLHSHEKVREAAVRGVAATGARSFLGEVVKAWIVRRDQSLTELEIRKHCYDRLPSYKVPQFIQFVDALPRNATGKVMKDELV